MGVIELLKMTDYGLLVMAFLLLYGGHFTPWTVIPGATDNEGKLKPVLCYVYGLGCVLLVMAGWSLARWVAGITAVGVWEPVKFAVYASVAAGAGTLFPRLLRMKREFEARGEDLSDGTPKL